jgi:hypothetical protein
MKARLNNVIYTNILKWTYIYISPPFATQTPLAYSLRIYYKHDMFRPHIGHAMPCHTHTIHTLYEAAAITYITIVYFILSYISHTTV